jgi:UDP-N-acetylmuramate--alanine ligase
VNWVENDFSENANKEFGELLIMAGAGDIDTMLKPVADLLNR